MSMRPNRAIAVSVIFWAVAESAISPSTRASCGDGVKCVESLMAREFPTTLKPFSKKRVTRLAPIPCDAPVTMLFPLLTYDEFHSDCIECFYELSSEASYAD